MSTSRPNGLQTWTPADRQGLLQLLLDTSASNAHPMLETWLGRAGLAQLVQRKVDSWLQRVDDGELAAQYAHHFPVAGAAADEYRNRFFEASDGTRLLTGIRFRRLELSEPFVEVVWQDRPFVEAASTARLLEQVARRYATFQPKYVRFDLAGQERVRPETWEGVSLQHNVLAAPVRVIARGTGVLHADRVTLRPARVQDILERYTREYERVLQAWPELRDVAPPLSRETLQEAEAEGLSFAIEVDGADAGVYTLQHSEWGEGHYDVAEILMYPDYRRRGFAPAVHVAACRWLESKTEGLLSGTIGAINAPSRRTALRAGRQSLKGTYRYRPTGSGTL